MALVEAVEVEEDHSTSVVAAAVAAVDGTNESWQCVQGCSVRRRSL
jgi:hypothetical protein